MGGGKEAVEDDGSGTLAGSIRYTPRKARRISSLSGAVAGISSLSDSGPNTFRKTHRDGARCVTRLRQRALAKLDAPPAPLQVYERFFTQSSELPHSPRELPRGPAPEGSLPRLGVVERRGSTHGQVIVALQPYAARNDQVRRKCHFRE